jgi:hypothetical protein
MKTSIKFIAPALGAAAIGAAMLLAPIASADTDPLVPYGTNPHTPYVLGYHVSNHDESNTTNGQLDTPFWSISAADARPRDTTAMGRMLTTSIRPVR